MSLFVKSISAMTTVLVILSGSQLASTNTELKEDNNSEAGDIADSNNLSTGQLSLPYVGQNVAGAGHIYDVDIYVRARYGREWGLEEKTNLPWSATIMQHKTSIFAKYGDSVLTTIYGYLKYHREKLGYYNFPNTFTHYDVRRDPLYHLYKNSIDYAIRPNIPTLYLKVRDVAITRLGYNEKTPLPQSAVPRLTKIVAQEYGYNISLNNHYAWTFNNNVVNHIRNGQPVIWSPSRGSYANRSMVVNGYAIYSRYARQGNRWVKEYKQFMRVNDNQSQDQVHFDYSDYAMDVFGGVFGTFTSK